MKIRQFAKAQGVLAKTDKIDSRVISEFGAFMQPAPRPIQTVEIRHFRDLLARKRQLMESRTQELNRSHKATRAIERSHNRSLKFLQKEIAWVDDQLEKHVSSIAECSGLIEPDTLMRDNYRQPLGCHYERKTHTQAIHNRV